MDRAHTLSWLHRHPDSVHTDPDVLVDRLEHAIERHTHEDAWLEAKQYAERRVADWATDWGFHASDAYVARETCMAMARALRRHEPHFHHGDEEHLAGAENLADLEAPARRVVEEWILERAEEEMHRIWREVVNFTKREARALSESGQYSDDLSDWDANANYKVRAACIAQILAQEFEAHANRY